VTEGRGWIFEKHRSLNI